ncbi:MAG: hypothetical protein L7H10_04345 [Vulcanisaeta sp.]|nr:hypothetical protein [Vulcanisaeta sp.]
MIRDKTEEVVLGARTVVYVMLRSRVLRRISSMDHRKAIIADSALLKYVYGLSYEDAKQLFHKLVRRDLFKIRV